MGSREGVGPGRCPKNKMFGTESDSRQWVSVGRECHSYAPTALLGWHPGIAVVRTTFLKWVLMFFTAGKYAIMGIFPPPDSWTAMPPKLPSHTAHFLFSLTEACLFLFSPAASVPSLHTEEPARVSLPSVSGTCDSAHGWAARSCPGGQAG